MPNSQISMGRRVVTVGSLSACLMLFQLLLTRIFSVIFFSHLGFAAVSIGMLGLAAAGIRLYTAPERFLPENTSRDVARSAAFFALSLVVCTFALSRLGAGIAAFTWKLFAELSVAYVLALIPFYFGGLAISLMLTHYQKDFAKLYAADLVGAGLGGPLALPLLPVFGGPGSLLVVATIVAGAAVMTCPASATNVRRLAGAIGIGCLALLCLDIGFGIAHLQNPKGRSLKPIFEKWNAFSRVAVYNQPQGSWALGPNYHGISHFGPMVDIDSSAGTGIARLSDANNTDYLGYELTSIGYAAALGTRTLVIGAGGGKDVLTALAFGMDQIDAVEINPIIVNDVMRRDFADFSGGIYSDPRVNVHVGDGRSYIRHATDSYDIIQLSLVDTWAATSAGAFALSENNLYTVEALEDYLQHLTPDGILTISRWSGLDVWRLLAELDEACAHLHIENMPSHLAIIETNGQSMPVTNLLFRRSPFDAPALGKLQASIAKAGFHWLYNPSQRSEGREPITSIILSDKPAEKAASIAEVDLRPSLDDWPFFFYHASENFWPEIVAEPGELFTKPEYLLVALLLLSSVLSIICIALPLLHSRQTSFSGNRYRALAIMPFYGALGLGFMFVEIAMMQRFVLYLGHPTFALTVVISSLLVGASLGSLWVSTHRFDETDASRRIGWVAAVAAFFLLVSAWIHPMCFEATQGAPFLVRVVITVALLAPVAAVLGTLMPSSMTCLRRIDSDLVPWAWGLNGFMSVVGSCAAALCAISWGFTRTFQAGAFFYVLAAIAAFSQVFSPTWRSNKS